MSAKKSQLELHREIVSRLEACKPAFRTMFKEDVMGVTAVVGDADPLTGKMKRNGAKYLMRGEGCGLTIITPKGAKGKWYEGAIGDAVRNFRSQMETELKLEYPGEEIGALMAQDGAVNGFIAWEIHKWYTENGIKTDIQTFEQ